MNLGEFDGNSYTDSGGNEEHTGIDEWSPSMLVLSNDEVGPAGEDLHQDELGDWETKESASVVKSIGSLSVGELDSSNESVNSDEL